MQAVESAVIAAAGFGSRLGMGMPKCMIEVEGRTVLSRLVDTLAPHVSTIHLVVGYREEMVIEYCARHHRDVVVVRNTEFRTTNTAYSLALGARHLSGKVLYLDGDLLLDPASVGAFLSAASAQEILVGLTDAKSENAVYALGGAEGELVRVEGFTRKEGSPYEWANIVAGPHDLMIDAGGYVFERLEERLPLTGRMLNLAEVDTPADLEAAKAFARRVAA